MTDSVRVRNICIPKPFTVLDETTASEIEHYANEDNVNIIYFEYQKPFLINGIEFNIYPPVTFENSSASILSSDIKCGDKLISYYGMGYFNYLPGRGECDVLYLGESGTTRKQTKAAEIDCDSAIVSAKNTVASSRIDSEKILFDEDIRYTKKRIG